MLIDAGAALNVTCTTLGWTPLHRACDAGHGSAVSILINRGADFSVADGYGRTPLHLACHAGDESVVKILIDGGADVNITDGQICTALHAACNTGHWPVVKLLIDAGADVNVIAVNGCTALHLACSLDRPNTHWPSLDIIPALILAGADTQVRDSDGNLPIGLIQTAKEKTVFKKAVESRALKPVLK
jgi:ankyrin repeat protein